MADIQHQIGIHATAKEIYDLIATKKGIQKWLTAAEGWNITGEENVGGTLTFHYGGNFHEMKILKLDSNKEVNWECPAGHPEWIGTTVDFTIENKGTDNVLHFTQAGWAKKTEFFEMCSQVWAGCVATIKKLAEAV